MKRSVCLLLLFLPLILVAQEERITRFDVRLEVYPDRSVTVTETISVYATGNMIKRGITRRLPKRRDMKGKSQDMDYKVIHILKDGQQEDYFSESSNGYLTWYVGQKEVFLEPGHYTYTLEYSVPNQVGFFEDYDEIYWNAIGTDVDFPVEIASCTVILPPGTEVLQEQAYVGGFGSKSDDYEVRSNGNALTYQVTRPLKPREGLTIAVGFPKGIIQPPGFLERFGALLVIIAGFIALVTYFVVTWWRYGVDPAKPVPYPIFESPNGLSAASLNYILNEHYNRKSLTASVIDLAIKGFLKIEEDEKGILFIKKKIYTLTRLKAPDSSLPAEEQALMKDLFRKGDTAVLDGEYKNHIADAYSAHQTSLRHQHRTFVRKGHNSRFLFLPILATLAISILAIIIQANSPAGEGINVLALVAFVPVAIGGLIAYIYLIKKPTVEKLTLQSHIEGFKMYLEMAEKDRLRLLNPPEQTPELFEAMLPFAFALGVEHQWSESFKKILDQAQYQPQWCNTQPIYFVDHFNSDFSRTAMATATKPSDGSGGGFSGSGGGGFSGGGGGGGGVGGW